MTNRNRKVSIITPTFNHERFIGECIHSVQAQSHENWEMFVVDDGSTDATPEVAVSMKDQRIRVIRQPNVGLAHLKDTYNKALALVSGEYVAILEGDDYWPKHKLENQIPSFEDGNVALVSGLTAIVDTEGEYVYMAPASALSKEATMNAPVGSALRTMMDPESLTYTFPVSTMLRTSALARIGGFKQPASLPLVDLPTFCEIALQGTFRFLPEVCGMWRRHALSTTKSRMSQILEGSFVFLMSFIREHRDRIPMTDAQLDTLELKWENYLGQMCMLRGRMMAAEGKYVEARQAYSEGLQFRRTRSMGVAMQGSAMLSSVRMPSEWLFRLTGRQDWRRLVKLSSGDLLVSGEDLARPRPRASWRGE